MTWLTRISTRIVVALVAVGIAVALGVSLVPSATATASPPTENSLSQARVNAQSLVVASDALDDEPKRDSYAATTEAEIAALKAAEEAARQAEITKRQLEQSRGFSMANLNLQMTAPGDGAVRFPLSTFTAIGEGFLDRNGAHEGVDVEAPALTEIYAVADGVVETSSEAFYGYGVAVQIRHNIGGHSVLTTYGHMTYGSRVVVEGDTVKAGQLIGLVGSTGRSTGNHLHFETRIDGTLVDPLAWLRQNGAFAD